MTPLGWAAALGAADSAEFLLNYGADPNATAGAGMTPLDWAVDSALFNGDADVAAVLLRAGADPNAETAGGTHLHEAARLGLADVAVLLLKVGADPNARNKDSHTPLFSALFGSGALFRGEGKADMAALLLKGGADPNARLETGVGLTPLHLAVALNDVDVAAVLLEAGADPNARLLESGLTPLHRVGGNGYLAAILLEAGADPNARAGDGSTPLDAARLNGSEYVATVLKAGVRP